MSHILLYQVALEVHDCLHNEFELIKFVLFFFSGKDVVRFKDFSNDFVELSEGVGESHLNLRDALAVRILEINEITDRLCVGRNVF